MAEIVTFETPSLGDRSYLVTDGTVAVVIDPQRDVGRFLDAADERGVRITHVLETHMHNDYVSGGLDLARRTGAAYVVAAAEDVAFDRHAVTDGDELRTGSLVLRALHTPGHTPHHLSYALLGPDEPVAVFTGGSLLYGAVGRPDLVAAELTERLAREQHRSAHRLASELPEEAPIYPTHGFGSHCASVTDDILHDGTIAEERTRNPALTLDEETFCDTLLAGLHPYPAYYAHMGAYNVAGPEPIDLEPPKPLDRDELAARIAAGDWVVDLRQRRAFARSHVAGTVNVELRDDLPTYLGWVIDWGTPFVLLGATPDDVAEAQLMLARIGLDRPAGAATGEPEQWADTDRLRSWPVENWQGLAKQRAERDDIVVLDVRERWEWDSGHHPAALHIPFYALATRLDELPDGEVWVYCATGNRATVAASQLAQAGRQVVLVDDFCLPGDTPGAEESSDPS